MSTIDILNFALGVGWGLVIVFLSAKLIAYLRRERQLKRARRRWERALDSIAYAESPLTEEQQELIGGEFVEAIREYKALLREGTSR